MTALATSTSTAAPVAPAPSTALVLTPEQLLAHWQGHRRLTRRVIEAFPEDALFTFAVGGMRPFAAYVMECLDMAVPVVRGVATGTWRHADGSGVHTAPPPTKAELLALWDAATAELDRRWAEIPPHRFQAVDLAFGRWEGPGYGTILYAIDNEVHHRAQGYVYLRALGVEPPAFYDRR